MICALLRKCGIMIWSEAEILKEIKDMQAQAQPAPAAVRTPLTGTGGQFVSINTNQLIRGGK